VPPTFYLLLTIVLSLPSSQPACPCSVSPASQLACHQTSPYLSPHAKHFSGYSLPQVLPWLSLIFVVKASSLHHTASWVTCFLPFSSLCSHHFHTLFVATILASWQFPKYASPCSQLLQGLQNLPPLGDIVHGNSSSLS
jgi:hypothetical protein